MSNETQQSRRRQWTGLVAVLASVGILLTACGGRSGGPGVASVSPTSTSGGSASATSQRASALAYSKCMRAHGIKDFPDPGPDGEISINVTPGSDLTGPRFDAANNACKSLMPQENSSRNPAVVRAAALKYARCMRAHGIKKFPDPGSDGGIQISAGPDLDPSSPQFKAADKACKHYLPGGGSGRSEHTSGGGE